MLREGGMQIALVAHQHHTRRGSSNGAASSAGSCAVETLPVPARVLAEYRRRAS
jgi:hypothetical protein